jgi:hypothetical protein
MLRSGPLHPTLTHSSARTHAMARMLVRSGSASVPGTTASRRLPRPIVRSPGQLNDAGPVLSQGQRAPCLRPERLAAEARIQRAEVRKVGPERGGGTGRRTVTWYSTPSLARPCLTVLASFPAATAQRCAPASSSDALRARRTRAPPRGLAAAYAVRRRGANDPARRIPTGRPPSVSELQRNAQEAGEYPPSPLVAEPTAFDNWETHTVGGGARICSLARI